MRSGCDRRRWWCAVFRLGLAPRWPKVARMVAAYSLRIQRCGREARTRCENEVGLPERSVRPAVVRHLDRRAKRSASRKRVSDANIARCSNTLAALRHADEVLNSHSHRG